MSEYGIVPAVVLRRVAGHEAGSIVSIDPNDPRWRAKIATGSVKLLDVEIVENIDLPEPDLGDEDPED